ncbi:MAG: von willebrand factor type a [Crocinitomicaceae bacterium]|nr:von willebrand factor type a [Crocinitomicaceae bacterium]
MKAYHIILVTFLIIWTPTFSVFSQNDKQEDGKIRILFIFDGSNSMNAQWEKSSKIAIAKKLMLQTLDSLKNLENVDLALRVYGHQTRIVPGNQDCSDTRLEIPFNSAKVNYSKIINKIRSIEPKGTTPIARSLQYSANDFPECKSCRNIIILLTDGIEACDEDPCAVSLALKAKNIKLKPFVIGLGLDSSYMKQFDCIGEFLSAESEDSFKSVLSFVISQALNNTTVQVNLNNIKKEPLESDVTMSFYESKSGRLMNTYMHTINKDNNPDTLSLDPIYTYKLVVHTKPEVILDNIKLIPGKHNTIEANTPQGELMLKVQGNRSLFTGINCIVTQNKQSNTLNVQNMNTKEKYIVGNYDLEILSIPRIYFDNVKINQSKITDIVIPAYGIVQINKSIGPAALFLNDNGKNTWLYDIDKNHGVTYLNIQPGKYKISYRFGRSNNTAHTIIKEFKINSGQKLNLTL